MPRSQCPHSQNCGKERLGGGEGRGRGGREVSAAFGTKKPSCRYQGNVLCRQLSTDKKPMGGFGMGKSGVMWPVPEVVERGIYSGDAGWGGKQKRNKGGRASDSSRFQFGKNKKKEADPF